jgi:hypothetical protein
MISLQKVTDRHASIRINPHHERYTRSKSPSNTETSDRHRSPVYWGHSAKMSLWYKSRRTFIERSFFAECPCMLNTGPKLRRRFLQRTR